MRKLLFIVLALAGCLLFAGQGGSVCAVRSAKTAVFSAGNAQADQWQCERVCNSDLNQPRLLREAEASAAAPVFLLGDPSRSVRTAARCVAACGCGTGVARITSTFRSIDLSVGTHAVDYYVYRLRRLII